MDQRASEGRWMEQVMEQGASEGVMDGTSDGSGSKEGVMDCTCDASVRNRRIDGWYKRRIGGQVKERWIAQALDQ